MVQQMRDEDRETLTEHRQRLERIEQGVGEIISVQAEHGQRLDRLETKVDRLETKVDRLETKVDRLETKVDAHGEMIREIVGLLNEHGEILSDIVNHLKH